LRNSGEKAKGSLFYSAQRSCNSGEKAKGALFYSAQSPRNSGGSAYAADRKPLLL